MNEFLKQKVFVIIIILLAILVATKSFIQLDTANVIIWLIVAILHILNLVREYKKYYK